MINSKGRNGKILSTEPASLSRTPEERPPCCTFSTNSTDELHLKVSKCKNQNKTKPWLKKSFLLPYAPLTHEHFILNIEELTPQTSLGFYSQGLLSASVDTQLAVTTFSVTPQDRTIKRFLPEAQVSYKQRHTSKSSKLVKFFSLMLISKSLDINYSPV